MAALALASSEADDVFEAVASHLRRPPFSKRSRPKTSATAGT